VSADWDGPPFPPPTRTPTPSITDEDVQAALEATNQAALCDLGRRHGGVSARAEVVMRAGLASAFRPGGVVARAVADELDRLTATARADIAQQIDDARERWRDTCDDHYLRGLAAAAIIARGETWEQARDRTAEWREGRR